MGIRTKMKRLVTFFRRMLGGPYRSSLLKPKNAVNYIGAFEKMLVGEASTLSFNSYSSSSLAYSWNFSAAATRPNPFAEPEVRFL
jgi:hypothetical protein